MSDRELRPRALELSAEVHTLLLKLRKLTNTTGPATVSVEQIRGVEEALNCEFPDSIIAAFANRDDALLEQHGVRIEDVVDNTERAREMGHPQDVIAIGRHPDDHCFYCISKRSPSKSNPGVTEYDNFDGGSTYRSLTKWLKELIELEVDFHGSDPSVTEEEIKAFAPSLTEFAE